MTFGEMLALTKRLKEIIMSDDEARKGRLEYFKNDVMEAFKDRETTFAQQLYLCAEEEL